MSRLGNRVNNPTKEHSIVEKTKESERAKVTPIRLYPSEIKKIDNMVEKWKPEFNNLDRTKLIRACIKLAETSSDKALSKAIGEVMMGKI